MAKTNIEVSLKKKIHATTLRINKFEKWYCLKIELRFVFLVTFNIIICYNFPENFIEIHQVSQKLWIFTSSILTILANFLDIFTFTCYKKSNDVSIYKIISAVFWLGIILDRLLKNCIKLYKYWISCSSNMKVGGYNDPPRINYFQKAQP